jgi:hypothetical protein
VAKAGMPALLILAGSCSNFSVVTSVV